MDAFPLPIDVANLPPLGSVKYRDLGYRVENDFFSRLASPELSSLLGMLGWWRRAMDATAEVSKVRSATARFRKHGTEARYAWFTNGNYLLANVCAWDRPTSLNVLGNVAQAAILHDTGAFVLPFSNDFDASFSGPKRDLPITQVLMDYSEARLLDRHFNDYILHLQDASTVIKTVYADLASLEHLA